MEAFDYVIMTVGGALIVVGLYLYISGKKEGGSTNNLEGFGITPDLKKARYWLNTGASIDTDKTYTPALVQLAATYRLEPEPDIFRAEALYNSAASLGSTDALVGLAYMHLNGEFSADENDTGGDDEDHNDDNGADEDDNDLYFICFLQIPSITQYTANTHVKASPEGVCNGG